MRIRFMHDETCIINDAVQSAVGLSEASIWPAPDFSGEEMKSIELLLRKHCRTADEYPTLEKWTEVYMLWDLVQRVEKAMSEHAVFAKDFSDRRREPV